MKLRIAHDKIELDGRDITEAVSRIQVDIQTFAEVTLTMHAEVEAEVEFDLLKLEKQDHARFTALGGHRTFVRKR